MRKKAKKEIIRILALLGSAVLCAALLAAYMIQRYGPSGRYAAENVLLSAAVLDKINYKDRHPKTGAQARFIFNGIEFAYFDRISQELHQFSIDPATYGQFYQLVQSNKSLSPVTDEVQSQFDQQGPLATLSVILQTENAGAPQVNKVFQKIQFTENDYFRAQLLPRENEAYEWVYFYQPHIYQQVIHLFTKV